MTGGLSSTSRLTSISVVIPPEHSPSPLPSPSLATPGTSPTLSNSPLVTRPSLTPLRGNAVLPGSPVTGKRDMVRRGSSGTVPASPSTSYPMLRRDSASKTPFSGFHGSLVEESGAPVSPSTSFEQTLFMPDAASLRSIPMLDPTIPPLREIKKFFKRSSSLKELAWVGRGTWVREPLPRSAAAKSVSLANIKVEFFADLATHNVEGKAREAQEAAAKQNWIAAGAVRDGHIWATDMACAIAKELESVCPPSEPKPRIREASAAKNTQPRSNKRRPSVRGPPVETTPPGGGSPGTPDQVSERQATPPGKDEPTTFDLSPQPETAGPRSPNKPKQRRDSRTSHRKSSTDNGVHPSTSHPRQRATSTTDPGAGRSAGRHHRSVSEANHGPHYRPLVIGTAVGTRERTKSSGTRGTTPAHRRTSDNISGGSGALDDRVAGDASRRLPSLNT